MSEFLQLDDTPKVDPGFRLHTLQIWNWGTFDSSSGRVHTIHPAGVSTLLIGRNGTGKSTLIDALLTLLTPPNRRSYNVAAGSTGKSQKARDERTYIKGAYGNSSSLESHRAQTNFLRPGNDHYSVILGVFQNSQTGEAFTLAQMLYLDGQGKPVRFFCWADEVCSIESHFSNIRSMERLRAQLDKRGLNVTGTYTDYGRFLRKRTGMAEKAMDIFNQAVAVKEIHSLDEFIRSHMLQKKNWRDIVTKVLSHFDLLSEAHDALVKTRREVELLEPVAKAARSYEKASLALADADRLVESVDPFFAHKTVEIARPECELLEGQLTSLRDRERAVTEQQTQFSASETDLRVAIQSSGGERLKELERLIPQEESYQATKNAAAQQFQNHLRALDLGELREGETGFEQLLKIAAQQRAIGVKTLKDMESRRDALAVQLHAKNESLTELKAELSALLKRRTQLPESYQFVRQELCQALNLPADDLPFAAELIAVREDELAWEESIEKVLRTFALTLLVPDSLYSQVSGLIDQRLLHDARGRGMRLHYERISVDLLENARSSSVPDALPSKLNFRNNHALTPWIRQRLDERFDYRCCETIEVFQSERGRAITQERHIKHGFNRHEKDDRKHVRDHRSFVLGWDNQRKISFLKKQIAEAEADLSRSKNEQANVRANIKRLEANHLRLQAVAGQRYSDLDHWAISRTLQAYREERDELINSDDELKTLKAQLAEVKRHLLAVQKQRDDLISKIGITESELEKGRAFLAKAEADLAKGEALDADTIQLLTGQLTDGLTLASLFESKAAINKWTGQFKIDCQKKHSQQSERVTKAMGRYLREIPDQRANLSDDISGLPDFLSRRARLTREDLPRHTERFKQHLNEKVTQEVAILNDKLRQAAKSIERKIDQLNTSLSSIQSEGNGFMKLECIVTKDREISDFRTQLRSCLDGSFGSGEVADEERYQVIAKFIKRIKEEERWRDRVIDVRRWFHFAVAEYDKITNEQTSYYTDSAGQSGGEKARLAFTILVAAIAYQYNIDPDAPQSSRFHFVMVDEMFSKVDDKYSEYALDLFRRFGLQLLIVAPFDAKARITEPYVDHYLHVLKDKDRSQVFSMTAEEALPTE